MNTPTIWELRSSDDFRGVIVDMPWEWQTTYWMNWFNGTPLATIWPEVKVKFEFFEEEEKPACDFPPTSADVLILTRKALDLVSPLLEGNGEVLPLVFEEEELYLFNITKIMDCLDHSNIRANYFSTGRIMWVDEYAWKPDCLDDVHIFRIPETRSALFVSDVFKQLVERTGLLGLRFDKAS